MVTLPVLSSLTELLTGTVTDEFKKLLQPAALVAAAIFLTLNLALILPALVDGGIAPFVALERLPVAWQLALGTLVLLALGYLTNSLRGSFLSILNGNAFRNSPLVYARLKKKQQDAFDRLKTEVEKRPVTDEQKRAAYQLAYEFPRDREALAPTRLGNVLLSVSSYTWYQYSAHLDTLWPLMDPVLQAKDEKLHARVNDSRASLTFLSSVSVLLGVVAVELVIVGLAFQRPLHAILGVPAMLIAAYVVYRAAVKEALAWGRNMRTAFDLHLDALEGELGLRALPGESFTDRRKRWEDVSTWLAYGAVKFKGSGQAKQDVGWYKAPPAPVFEVKHPSTISVEKHRVFRSGPTPDLDSPSTKWFYGQAVDYVFMIANMETGWDARSAVGACLLVTDSKLLTGQKKVQGELFVAAPSAAAPPSGKGKKIEAKWHLGDPPALFWPLGEIPARSSYVLRYTARDDEVIVEVSPDGTADLEIKELKRLGPKDFQLKVRNNATGQAQVKVTIGLPKDQVLHADADLMEPNVEPVQFVVVRKEMSHSLTVQPQTSFVLVFSRESRTADT